MNKSAFISRMFCITTGTECLFILKLPDTPKHTQSTEVHSGVRRMYHTVVQIGSHVFGGTALSFPPKVVLLLLFTQWKHGSSQFGRPTLGSDVFSCKTGLKIHSHHHQLHKSEAFLTLSARHNGQ